MDGQAADSRTGVADDEDEGPGADAAPDAAAADTERRAQVVGIEAHAQRLDRVLVTLAPEFSRSHLQGLIEAGHVRVDGQVAGTASRKLRIGQRIEVDLVPPAESRAFVPEAMDLVVVHEDEDLLVIDKPAGLVVHPAAGNWSGTLLNGLLARDARAASLPRAGIVHRLDKDTSGLMVVARSLPAHAALVRALAAREVGRQYLALAPGWPGRPGETRSVDAPIGRDPGNRLRMAVTAAGKPARTDFTLLARAADGTAGTDVALLRCRLHSGRTHQIRVHAAHLGHPLVADRLYGGRAAAGLERQALHAAWLSLAHPRSGVTMAWHAPLPSELAEAWRRLGLALPAADGACPYT